MSAAYSAMSMTSQLLSLRALLKCFSEEERLRALRHVCSALPRTAEALPEQARQQRRA